MEVGEPTVRVVVLGSGTVDPQPHRASSGFWLEMGGSPTLVDLGAGALRNALLAGLPVAAIASVVLTHHHPDHTADLVPFLFARKHATKAWRESARLVIYGPAGTQEFLEKMFAVWPSVRPEDDALSVIELLPETGPRRLGEGLELTAFSALHGDMTALCYRFEAGSKTVAFSGDTALCPGVSRAAEKADLFLCECSCFPRGVEPLHCRDVHLSWEDVAEVCQIAEPRRLVLTHLYESVLARKPDPAESLREVLTIPVELAEDLAVYEV